MSASENQIVVYQPNETVRLDMIDAYSGVATGECCQCENDLTSVALAKVVASGQSQFPIEEAA